MRWNGLELPPAYYQDDAVYLIRGDCSEVLPLIPDMAIGLVVTSPPYNCRKAYPQGDEWAWETWYSQIRDVLEKLYTVLETGGVLTINVPGVVRWQADHQFSSSWGDFDAAYKTHRNGEQVIGKGRIEPIGFRVFGMMQEIDGHIREPIVWVKGSEGNAIYSDYRMGCDSDPYMRPAHEFILLGSKGRWFHRGGTGRRGHDAVPFIDDTKDVWFISPQSNKTHPAVFPEELPFRLIRLFAHAQDSVILDPYFGVGTTAIAAKKLGRKCIGIEIEERYCEIAAKRCCQSVLDLSPKVSEGYERRMV